MPLSFNEVYDLYRNVAPKGMSLGQFSKKANTLFGSEEFSEGQRGLPSRLAGQANYWIDQAVPESWREAGGEFGASTFDLFGGNPEVGREVGREIPKTVGTWLPAIATAPFSAPVAAVGLGTTALLSGLESYGQSGSVAHGATSAAAPYVGGFVGRKAGEFALNAAQKLPFLKYLGLEGGREMAGVMAETGAPAINRVAQTVPDRLLRYLGGQVGGQAGMEGVQYGGQAIAQGTLSPDLGYGDMTLKDYVLQSVIGNLPFAALDVPSLVKPSLVSQRPVDAFKAEPEQQLLSDPAAMKKVALDAEYAKQRANLNFEKDPVLRQKKLLALEDWRKVKTFDLEVEASTVNFPKFDWGTQIVEPTIAKNVELAKSVGLPENAPLWMVAREKARLAATSEEKVVAKEALADAVDSIAVPAVEAVTVESVPTILGQAEQLAQSRGAELNLETVRQNAENLVDAYLASSDEAMQRSVVAKLNEEKVKAQRVTPRQSELHTAFADFHRLAKTPQELAEVKAVQDGIKNHPNKEGETKDVQNAYLSKWRAWKQEGSGDLGKLADSFKNINLRPDTAGPSVRNPEGGRAQRFATKEEAQVRADELNKANKDQSITTFEPRAIRGKFEVKPNYKTAEQKKLAYASQEKAATKVVSAAVPDLKPKDSVEELGAKSVYDNFDEWYKQWVDPTVDDLLDKSLEVGMSKEAAKAARRFFANKPADLNARKRALATAIWDMLPERKGKTSVELVEPTAEELAEMVEEGDRDVDLDDLGSDALKYAQIKLKAGLGFNWSLPEVGKVGDNWMLGKKNLGKSSVINVEALKSSGLKDAEIQLYRQIVPNAFTDKGFVSLEKLVAKRNSELLAAQIGVKVPGDWRFYDVMKKMSSFAARQGDSVVFKFDNVQQRQEFLDEWSDVSSNKVQKDGSVVVPVKDLLEMAGLDTDTPLFQGVAGMEDAAKLEQKQIDYKKAEGLLPEDYNKVFDRLMSQREFPWMQGAQLTPAERLRMQKLRQGVEAIPGVEGLAPNPAFYHLKTMSSAEAMLTDGQHFDIEGPVYYFNRIVSGIEGQGGGNHVLDQLLAHADKTNVPIINEPSATGNLDKTALPEWYRRKGFVQASATTGDSRLVYWPGTRAALGMKSELVPSLSNLWGRAARASGESQETIAAMMPFFKAMEKLLPLDNKNFGLLLNDVAMKNGYIYGAADNQTKNRGRFLLAPFYQTGDKVAAVRDASIFALHEAGHAIEPFLKNTPAYNELKEFIGKGGKDLEDGVAFIKDHLLGDAKDSPAINELLASRNPDELLANMVGLGWALPRLSADQQRSLALLGPKPIRSVYQKIVDFGHRFFSYMKAAMFGKQVSQTDGAKMILKVQKMLDSAQKEMKRADQDLTDLNRMQDANENLWDDARTSQFTQEENELQFARIIGKDREAGAMAKLMRNWFSSGWSHAKRNPDIAGAWSAMYDHGTAMTQHHNNALFPLYGQVDPNSGTVIIDKQAAKDRKRVEQGNDSRASKLISDIWTWNQNPENVATEVTMDKLKNAADPKGKDLYKRLMLAPKETRNAVNNYTTKAHLSVKQIQDALINATANVEAPMYIAMYISKAMPERFQSAPKDAQLLIEGQRNATSADPRAQMLGQQQLATARAQLGDETFQKALELAAASETKVEDLKSFMQGGFSRRLGKDLPGRKGFFSRMRFGEQLMSVVLPNGKSPVRAEPVPKGAEAAWVKMQEAKYGTNITVRVEKSKNAGVRVLKLPDGFNELLKEHQDKQTAILTAAGVDPEVIEQLRQSTDFEADLKLNEAVSKQIVAPGTRTMAPAELDMVAVHDAFMAYMARKTADVELNARLVYAKSNPALRDQPELVAHFDKALNQYKTPDSKFGRALAQGNFLYYMAGTVPTHLNNVMQSWMTLTPELVARGLPAWKATQLTTSAAKDVGAFTWDLAASGVKRRLGLNDEYAKWKDPEERKLLKRYVEEGGVGFGTFDELRNNEVDAAADLTYIAKKGRLATLGEKATSPLRALASMTLKAYATTEHFNVRTAFIAGIRLAKQKGMTANEAYDFAKDIVRSATYQGGRAGRPVAPFEGQHKLVGHLAYGLQTYNLGWLGQLATNVSRWRDSGLSPVERSSARKAAMTQLGLQLAAAGALGMPFVGAGLALLEKVLGVDLKGRLYQGLSQLLDQDEQEGSGLADIAMKGGANALLASVGLPLDFASRFAIGGVVGMNEYDGWQPNAAFGPTAGIVSNVLAGLKGAYDGDWGKAMKEFSPSAIRRGVDYFQHPTEERLGQVTDSSGAPMPTTVGEDLGYALGFVPSRLAKLRQFQSYERTRHFEESAKYSSTVEQLADLVLQSPQDAQVQFADVLAKMNGTKTAAELASDVAAKATMKSYSTDIRSGLDRGTANYMMGVAKGIGVQSPLAQQVERLKFKQQIMQSLGVNSRPSRPVWNSARRADLLQDELSPFESRRARRQQNPTSLFGD